ncbi:MAG TPA: DUF58 domain-containing protein [Longimicrobiaceae bacterium]|nr:DUF58 domain-containing protein [Longimicrobiaceae bacterium]
MPVQGMAGAQFVDPKVLARIDNLKLLATTVVDGFINGLHRSPYFGLSLDFAEHRQYMPGDDIRRVDWRLYARTDRYYVKEFEADTNANFLLLLDLSRSMSYSSGGVSKLDYARYLAASLAYFSHQQRDRVGLVTFDTDTLDYVPPSAKHLDVVLHTLDRAQAGRPGALGPPLRKIADQLRRRGIVVLISDLYEEPDAVVEAMTHLRGKGNDLIVFHLLDPAELEFPFDDATNFEDLETGERLPLVPEALREQYRELVAGHVSTLSRVLGENQIDYAMFNTGLPLDHALFNYLSSRERLSRVR